MNIFSFPKNIKNRLTTRLKNSVSQAAKKNGSRPMDFVYALSREHGSLAKNILEAHYIDSTKIQNIVKNDPRVDSRHAHDDIKMIVTGAIHKAYTHDQPYIGTEHFLYSIILPLYKYYKHTKNTRHKSSTKKFPYTQESMGKLFSRKAVYQIKKHLDAIFSQNINLTSMEAGDIAAFHAHANQPDIPLKKMRHAQSQRKLPNKKHKQTKKDSRHSQTDRIHDTNTPALNMFCQDLNIFSEKSAFDPVIGRKRELDRMLVVLARRTKNNPILVGEPGVGKTAIVHGLAQRITAGEIPLGLLHKRIFSLNLNSLISGTMFRGDFESRIHAMITEASRPDVILFIDEIHMIIGAGSSGGPLDIANILKPALANGDLRCIGATTQEEYKKYIEPEGALERRFQPIWVEEETVDQSMVTLSSVKQLYEKHHGVKIDEAAIKTAVNLSVRYINDRFLPDKALDLLDESASRLKNISSTFGDTIKLKSLYRQKEQFGLLKKKAISQEKYQDAITFKHKEIQVEQELQKIQRSPRHRIDKPLLTSRHIEESVSEMIGVPLLDSHDTPESLNFLQDELSRSIVGQEDAVHALIQALKRKRAGMTKPNAPIGSFLFIGPSGVGKTALARTFAQKTNQNLVTLNMAEYAEPHTISRIIGSPPGYVGYGEGGEVTEKIRRNPYSVVLFDEIEKAHPQIHSILLSILDEGKISDAMGKRISFCNSTIILTSNLNSQDMTSVLGFSKPTQMRQENTQYTDWVKDILKPEIINRIDKIISFNVLGEKEIFKITNFLLGELKEKFPNIMLKINRDVVARLARLAYRPDQGARHIRSTIEEELETPLAEYLMEKNNPKEEMIVKIKLERNNIKIS